MHDPTPPHATMPPSINYTAAHAAQADSMNHPNTTLPGHIPIYGTFHPSVQYTPQRLAGDFMTPSAFPIRQSPDSFKYATASLEGMPADLKLEILHAIHDLPSLRRLKLASREYYLVARSHTRSFAKAFRGKWHPDKPWPRLDGVFFQAVKEWHTEIQPAGIHRYTWRMPGCRGFSFCMNEYVAARIYRLTGEYPGPEDASQHPKGRAYYRKAVSSHVQNLRRGFRRRFDSGQLQPTDFEHAETMVFLESQGDDRSRVEAMVAVMMGREPLDPAVEKRKKQVEVVVAAVRLYPHIAERLLEDLEKDEIVCHEGDGKYSLED